MSVLLESTGNGGGTLLAVVVILYFVPTLAAALRQHHQKLAIFALNLLLGWTVIGWVVALVWALTQTEKKDAGTGCPNCNSKVPPGQRYCQNCGMELWKPQAPEAPRTARYRRR